MSSIVKTLALAAGVSTADATYSPVLANVLFKQKTKTVGAGAVKVCVNTGSCLQVMSSDPSRSAQEASNSNSAALLGVAICDLQIKGRGRATAGLTPMALDAAMEISAGSTVMSNLYAPNKIFTAIEAVVEEVVDTVASAVESVVGAPAAPVATAPRQLTETDAWKAYWNSQQETTTAAPVSGLRGSAPKDVGAAAMTIQTAFVTFRNMGAFAANFAEANGLPADGLWVDNCAALANSASAMYGVKNAGGAQVTVCDSVNELVTLKTWAAGDVAMAMPDLKLLFTSQGKIPYMVEDGLVEDCTGLDASASASEEHLLSFIGDKSQVKLIQGLEVNEITPDQFLAPVEKAAEITAHLGEAAIVDALGLAKFTVPELKARQIANVQ